ncbi:sensor domain-containing diguanylate cyclase [Domibacillus sp. A3M-37]|uniref:sensor domain-containing diguanylate cyclase n=1 Tax=Domibacillus sp. A3M-37 TaxID=2962037 RepID=UPI0020B7A709|nr:sensor domain-containing diguanylate cyclase [Domibacillus sp. A3M-37]MCP3762747.1 sensor domain-containing diguanylate cyclase [Domibacillus sp. A3M-37]
MKRYKGMTLRFMIGVLVLVSALLTAIVGGYSAFSSTRNSLALNHLENNYQYAKKISSETNILLTSMQENMNFIANNAQEQTLTKKETDLLLQANKQYFNSIFFADSNRVIQQVSPTGSGLAVGTQLTSEVSIEAVQLKKPFISDPYLGTSGRLILLVSSPVFDKEGTYKGFVGGTIYLEEDNVLSTMLNEHFYGNGSYVYVVDRQGHLIFHPNKKRINEFVSGNAIIQKVISGKSSFEQTKNSLGTEYFIGYSYEKSSGWGIVSQTPVSVLKEPLNKLIVSMIMQGLPFLLFILLIAFGVSFIISKPLYQLAKFSEDAIADNKTAPLDRPIIRSRVYEVRQLAHHIHNHFDQLNSENRIDGLTGIANRKTFEQVMQGWIESQLPFCLILLDIDHFKKVNDTFGHVKGDEVLVFTASIMQKFSRVEDVCFRFGGEEFGILVKTGNMETAANLAERLRSEIETSKSPTGGAVTISLGIAVYPEDAGQSTEVIEKADFALYQSKADGRNKTTIYAD